MTELNLFIVILSKLTECKNASILKLKRNPMSFKAFIPEILPFIQN